MVTTHKKQIGMEEKVIKGKLQSGKDRHGSMRGSHDLRLDEIIAKIKFRRTIRRLIKLIKS